MKGFCLKLFHPDIGNLCDWAKYTDNIEIEVQSGWGEVSTSFYICQWFDHWSEFDIIGIIDNWINLIIGGNFHIKNFTVNAVIFSPKLILVILMPNPDPCDVILEYFIYRTVAILTNP
jgi:hypothetical protein